MLSCLLFVVCCFYVWLFLLGDSFSWYRDVFFGVSRSFDLLFGIEILFDLQSTECRGSKNSTHRLIPGRRRSRCWTTECRISMPQQRSRYQNGDLGHRERGIRALVTVLQSRQFFRLWNDLKLVFFEASINWSRLKPYYKSTVSAVKGPPQYHKKDILIPKKDDVVFVVVVWLCQMCGAVLSWLTCRSLVLCLWLMLILCVLLILIVSRRERVLFWGPHVNLPKKGSKKRWYAGCLRHFEVTDWCETGH